MPSPAAPYPIDALDAARREAEEALERYDYAEALVNTDAVLAYYSALRSLLAAMAHNHEITGATDSDPSGLHPSQSSGAGDRQPNGQAGSPETTADPHHLSPAPAPSSPLSHRYPFSMQTPYAGGVGYGPEWDKPAPSSPPPPASEAVREAAEHLIGLTLEFCNGDCDDPEHVAARSLRQALSASGAGGGRGDAAAGETR